MLERPPSDGAAGIATSFIVMQTTRGRSSRGQGKQAMDAAPDMWARRFMQLDQGD
jgi:hypothetical protein